MIVLSCFCVQDKKTRSQDEATVTLLCRDVNENSVFRDGRSYPYLVFLTLTTKDEEGRDQPCLLESWEHSEDFSEWTFHLRTDIRWQDDVPVTSRDVKFSLEMWTDPNILYEIRLFDEIIVLDDFTYQLRAQKGFNALIYRWCGICPAHLLADLDINELFSWEFWKHPVGNGPYRYVRHVPDMMVELEINPDYYGKEPKIKKVILKFGENVLTELLSENVDAVSYVLPSEVMKIEKDPRFDIYFDFNVTNVYSIVWNHQNALFEKSTVRRAITHAVNRRELNHLLTHPDNTPIFDVLITPWQYAQGSVPEPVSYDPEQAKRLLDAEGWVDVNEKGIREKSGREFRFSLLVEPDSVPSAVFVQNQIQNVGIHMEIVVVEGSVLRSRHVQGKFDAFLVRFGTFGFDWGFGGYDNPDLNRLIKAAYWSEDLDAYDRNTRKTWPIYQKDFPWLFLYPQVNYTVAHKRLRGLKTPSRIYPAQVMEGLWIEEQE